jgi:hypothetical protein
MFPEPARDRGSRMQSKSLRLVPRSKDLDGIAGHLRRRRHLGQQSAIRPVESRLAVWISIDPVALLVDGERSRDAAEMRPLRTQKAVERKHATRRRPERSSHRTGAARCRRADANERRCRRTYSA